MSTFLMKEKHPNLIKIGKIIRDTRKEKGYSQEDFASQAQLGRTYMGRIERGEQNMSIQTLIQIALVLRVEVAALIPNLRDLIPPKE
ncbi:helix-turn-helix transcriptional regulator [Legionella pneumophila serogroup 1]